MNKEAIIQDMLKSAERLEELIAEMQERKAMMVAMLSELSK